MKDSLVYIICGLCILTSCSQPKKNYSISMDAQSLGKSTIILTKGGGNYLYDLQITDSYLVILDNKSDTVMQAYTLNNILQTKIFCLRTGENNRLLAPQFVRSDYRSLNKANQISIVDNNIYLKQITLTAKGINLRTRLLDKGLVNSKDYNITTKEIYAVPISGHQKYSYFFYNIDSGYYWVNPSPIISEVLPHVPIAFSSNLCVNEQKKSIVTAFRFTNYVSFYDLEGNIQSTCHFGENQTITPLCMGEKLDIENSTKCFTSIYCTPKYVYCLYDGTTDFTAQSRILVFNWNGKHVKTWLADRNLRRIAIDKNNKTLYGISANPIAGQDVVKYLLK